MEELYNLGISENTINDMIMINNELSSLSKEEIIEKENILRSINCDETQIMNIISSNSIFLSRTNSEVTKLINYLINLGFTTLNILIDSNPDILNLDIFEIEKYIKKRIDADENLETIIDELDSKPYLFNEL